MKNFKLFIDETGHPHHNHKSKYFVLVGCIIEGTKQLPLKTLADQIKYKYWNRTDIVFHSEEMGKQVGDYAQFAADPVLAANFEKQLLQFINTAPLVVCAAIVDKDEAYKVGWTEDTIVRKAAESLMEDFLAFVYGNDKAHGRIVFESSGVQRDAVYLQAFNKYLDPNWERRNPQFDTVRQHLTSITFANKLNHDTEMQLADMLSYAVICKFMRDNKIKEYAPNSYETKIITVLEQKTLRLPAGVTRQPKLSYYKKIKGVGYYPKSGRRRLKKKA